MRILCIDDDITFVTMYKSILQKHCPEDDEIFTAMDAESGIALFNEYPADIVITDLIMPETSGLDVLKHVKEKNPMTEVIVVTGQESVDSAVEAMKLGARDYMTKPLNHDLLIEKIENIREYIERGNEAEEYRFAKEAIEEGASRTITELEIKLSVYMELAENAQKLIEGNDSQSDVIQNLKKLFDDFRETEA